MTYMEKLRDPRWQKRRLEIFGRDNWTCQDCGATDKTLHVHHLVYRFDPWEAEDDEIVTLCGDCHEKRHSATHEDTEAPTGGTGELTAEDEDSISELRLEMMIEHGPAELRDRAVEILKWHRIKKEMRAWSAELKKAERNGDQDVLAGVLSRYGAAIERWGAVL